MAIDGASKLAWLQTETEVREAAQRSVAEFHGLLDSALASINQSADDSLLSHLVNAKADERLTDEEIKRSLSIIFFGGISTLEGLLLNALWALFENPGILQRVRADPALLPEADAMAEPGAVSYAPCRVPV